MESQDSSVDMEPSTGLTRWIDDVVPPRLLVSEDTRLRARVLVVSSLALALGSALVLALQALTRDFDVGLAVAGVDAGALAALPWVQRWTGSTRIAGAALSFILVVSLPIVAGGAGLFPAPVVGLFGVIPIIACYFVGRSFGLAIAAFLSAATLALSFLPPASAAQSAALQPTQAAALALMPIACALLSAAHERRRERNEAALRRRSVQLAQARAAAEEADRHKSEFLRHVSHELRTPLNAILGYSELIHEELAELAELAERAEHGQRAAAKDPSREIADDVAKIQGAGRHLLGLINDLLDISKIEAGALDLYFEPVDLHELFAQVQGAIEPQARAGGNTIVQAIDADVGELWTDGQRLSQILVNLGGNACKFTEGGTITLEAAADPDDPRRVQLRVRDTGVGMNPEQASRIFAPFVQVDDSMIRRRQGTGLGLMITRMLSERLGGGVVVDSRPGEGSVFTVTLPRTPPTDVSHF